MLLNNVLECLSIQLPFHLKIWGETGNHYQPSSLVYLSIKYASEFSIFNETNRLSTYIFMIVFQNRTILITYAPNLHLFSLFNKIVLNYKLTVFILELY